MNPLNRSAIGMAMAMAAIGGIGVLPGRGFSELRPVHVRQPDLEKESAAQAKRERKNARRAELVGGAK